MHALKMKLRELAEENRMLHEELKRTVVQEMLNEGLDVPGVRCVWGKTPSCLGALLTSHFK